MTSSHASHRSACVCFWVEARFIQSKQAVTHGSRCRRRTTHCAPLSAIGTRENALQLLRWAHSGHRQRMLDPGSYRCSNRPGPKISPPIFGPVKMPNCGKHFAEWLGGSIPERYGESISKRRSPSEAWELGHLLHKLFRQWIQAVDLVVLAQSRNPVRLPVPGGGHRQLVASAATHRRGHWAQKLLGRDIQTSVKPHQPSETLARR
jgi:hypothetical protein